MNRKLRKIANLKEAQEKKKKVYFMQSVALQSYARFCIKLNEPPKADVVEMLSNCEDVKKLMESHKIFISHL